MIDVVGRNEVCSEPLGFFSVTQLMLAILLATLVHSAAAETYFIDSATGSDEASGLSEDGPWKTLKRINALQLKPGDSIQLKNGSRWQHGLEPKGSGTPKEPIRLTTYGDGPRPVIHGGKQPALRLVGQEGWIVEGIEFTNDADSKIDAVQVMCGTDKATCRFLRIKDCVARDSGRSGFHIGDANAAKGEKRGGVFEDVVVENCIAFGHPDSGIFVHGVYPVEKARDVTIRGCIAHSNGWDGIKIYTAARGMIEHCVAYKNGLAENARVGIWCWDSDDVVIQYCESYDNRTPGMMDGGGFDIDWSCRRCKIQYCYSHDNDGAGILLMGVKKGLTTASCVRFNISQNDGRKNGYGGITCYGQLEDSQVYNNAVFNSSEGPGACLLFRGNGKDGYPQRIRVFNNILISGGERDVVNVPPESLGHDFDFNCYHSLEDLRLRWDNKVLNSFADFQRTSNQEKNGMARSPGFLAKGKSRTGRLPTSGFRLSPSSPCRRGGTQWQRAFGTVDYWDGRITHTERMNIGPHQ